jgi:hypothetical protein
MGASADSDLDNHRAFRSVALTEGVGGGRSPVVTRVMHTTAKEKARAIARAFFVTTVVAVFTEPVSIANSLH